MLDLDTKNICDNHPTTKYECLECLKELDDCDCLWDDATTEIDVYCTDCKTTHVEISVDDLLGPLYAMADDDTYSAVEVESKPTGPTEPKYYYNDKCRHYNVPLEFPDGTVVYASSNHKRKPGEPAPDFGMYLDSSWKPACLAYQVEWKDYGLPVYYEAAAKAIIDVYNKARKGLWVEVGCIGGHGRTGTALACMGVLAGLEPEAAIAYVRENYCDHAVEAEVQHWYVQWFQAFVQGGTAPKRVERSYNPEEPDVVFPAVKFPVPIAWQEFDTDADPQSEPPADIVETVRDRYVRVTYYDEVGKYQSFYVDDTNEQFEYVKALADEQAATRQSQPATLADMIGVQGEESYEPY